MTDVPPLLTKCCSKCGEWKLRDNFSRHVQSKDGLRWQCKDCDRRCRRRACRSRGVSTAPADTTSNLPPSAPATIRHNVAANIRYHANKDKPEVREKRKEWDRIQRLRKQIALATCERLNVDLWGLAKAQYLKETNTVVEGAGDDK